jgi:transcriptional regulator with XRE-family HTH domain
MPESRLPVLDGAMPRRSGVKLDASRLDYELGRRGVTARQLAVVAGISEVTLSRSRHGRPVTEGTLRQLTRALLGIPLLIGADLLIAPVNEKTAGASTSPAVASPEGTAHATAT